MPAVVTASPFDRKLELLILLQSSIDFREKVLKLVQYLSKLVAARLERTGHARLLLLAARLSETSKACSAARRLFVLGRWVKTVPDIRRKAGEKEAPAWVSRANRAEAICAFGVDALQDAITLEKIGVLASRTLPPWLERAAALLETVLALTQLVAGYNRYVVACSEETAAKASAASSESRRRKVSTAKLALLKYAADLCKGCNGGRLPLGVTVTQADLCALFSSAVSIEKAFGDTAARMLL